jgi:hypothetical protein
MASGAIPSVIRCSRLREYRYRSKSYNQRSGRAYQPFLRHPYSFILRFLNHSYGYTQSLNNDSIFSGVLAKHRQCRRVLGAIRGKDYPVVMR